MDAKQIENLTQELFAAVAEAEKLGYRPTYFKQMLAESGGFETINRVLASNKPSDGFSRLWELGRLDLTCEAFIVEKHWREHFDPELVAFAEKRLRQAQYPFRAYAPPQPALATALTPGDGQAVAPMQSTAQRAKATSKAKYWHVAEAVDALGKPATKQQIQTWLAQHFPEEDHSDLRENLAHLCVNDKNRRHYDRSRQNWRTAPPRPILATRINMAGSGSNTTFQTYEPALHGHWTLQADADGQWAATPLATDPVDIASAQREADLAAIAERTLDQTTRQTLVNARLGQGLYRKQLMQLWDSACAVTGVRIPALLRASHCKPWRDCSDQQRLDPHNGLLLCANLDALFDAHLISFDDEGHMLFSTRISAEEQQQLGLQADLRRAPCQELKAYLAQHRNVFMAQKGQGDTQEG